MAQYALPPRPILKSARQAHPTETSMPHTQDHSFDQWMNTLSNVEAQIKPPTAEDHLALQRSMQDLSMKFNALRNDYDDELQRIEDYYRDELSHRDRIEHDLRKRLHYASQETARLQGEHDVYLKQLSTLKPPTTTVSRASSDAGRSTTRPAAAGPDARPRPRSYSRPAPKDESRWRPRSQPPPPRRPKQVCRTHAGKDPRPRWCRRCEDELREGPRKCPSHQNWEPRPRGCMRCLEEWRG